MQAATKVSHHAKMSASGDPVGILSFSGDIASTSKETIMQAYAGMDAAVTKVLLDFTGVDYINSSGIAIIIQLLLDARKSGRHTIGIFGLTPHFQKVFTMVGVAKYAHLSPDEATALASF